VARTNYITKENVVEQLLSDELIVQSYVYSYKSKRYWKIIEPLTVQLSNGRIISIEKGFYYDMSTVPQPLWGILSPINDGLFGYLIHDWLYINKDKHTMTQWECDDEMLFWTNIVNKNKIDNYFRWFFVKYAFGWLYWNKII
jgi:hypothetical protein